MGVTAFTHAVAEHRRHQRRLFLYISAATMAARCLQIGLGATLTYDALERFRFSELELLSNGRPALLAGLLAVQAAVGACTLGLGLNNLCGRASSGLAVTGYLVSVAIYWVEPNAYFAADLVQRWCLLWLAAMPSQLAKFGILLQCSLMYGISLLYKSPSAYIWEGHAMRSMLLTEEYGQPQSLLWQWAVWLSFSPFGAWLTRSAYLCELISAAAGVIAVVWALYHRACPGILGPYSRTSHSVLAASLAAPVPLHVCLLLTCRLGSFPLITMTLHAAAHCALGEIFVREITASTFHQGSTPSKVQTKWAQAASWRQGVATSLLVLSIALPLMEACLPEEVSRKIARTIGLSAKWNMFSMAEGAPLTSGRTVSFILGRHTSHAQVTGSAEFEIALETLVARTGKPADDFSYGLRHATVRKHSFRWMLYQTKLRGLDTGESRALTAASACSRAKALWRRGRLPGPPEEVSIYQVYYDLPRQRGAAHTAAWALNIEPSLAKGGLSSTYGRWTAATAVDPVRSAGHEVLWPRAVVAHGTILWDCKRAKEVADQVPITYAFDELPSTMVTKEAGPWRSHSDGTLQWQPPVRSGNARRRSDPSPPGLEKPVSRSARAPPKNPPDAESARDLLQMSDGRVRRQDEVHSPANMSLHLAYPYDGQVIHLQSPRVVKMAVITLGFEGPALLNVGSYATFCYQLEKYERRQCLPRPRLVMEDCYTLDVRTWRVPHTLRLSGRMNLEEWGLNQLVENASSWVRLSTWLNGVPARPSLVWVDLDRHVVRTSAVRRRDRSIALCALDGERSADQLLRRYARAFDVSWSGIFRTEATHLFSSMTAVPVGSLELLQPSLYALELVTLVIHAVTGFLVQGRDVASSDFTFDAESDVHLTNVRHGTLSFLADCVASVIKDDVPGTFVEAGAWRGGAALVMKAALHAATSSAHSAASERASSAALKLVDTFDGIPLACSTPEESAVMFTDPNLVGSDPQYRTDATRVQATFRRFGLGQNVELLQHTFPCVLESVAPGLRTHRTPSELAELATLGIALLRLDVTVPAAYTSALETLYPLVSEGGLVFIDDWQRVDVQAAVMSFRLAHGIGAQAPVEVIDTTAATAGKLRIDAFEKLTREEQVGISVASLAGGKVAVWRKPSEHAQSAFLSDDSDEEILDAEIGAGDGTGEDETGTHQHDEKGRSAPIGHLKPIFEALPHRRNVNRRESIPSQAEFLSGGYASGWGIPLLMKGVAKTMPAWDFWRDDEILAERYGDEVLYVESSRAEAQVVKSNKSSMVVRDFLRVYNKSDGYAITRLSDSPMLRDVTLPRFMQCGYGTSFLNSVYLWWSSGFTSGVIHSDATDNLNCLVSGRKRLALFHPRLLPQIERTDMGWVSANQNPVYNMANARNVDAGRMDLQTYPNWTELEWTDVQMEAGDCLFLPAHWYHYVASEGRNMAVNLWWWRHEGTMPVDTCTEAVDAQVHLNACTFGYRNSGNLTHCEGVKQIAWKPLPGADTVEPYADIYDFVAEEQDPSFA